MFRQKRLLFFSSSIPPAPFQLLLLRFKDKCVPFVFGTDLFTLGRLLFELWLTQKVKSVIFILYMSRGVPKSRPTLLDFFPPSGQVHLTTPSKNKYRLLSKTDKLIYLFKRPKNIVVCLPPPLLVDQQRRIPFSRVLCTFAGMFTQDRIFLPTGKNALYFDEWKELSRLLSLSLMFV